MKVGDLVKPARSRGELVGLVTNHRAFETRDDVVYVHWRSPEYALDWCGHVDRWYDVSSLSLVERAAPIAYSADPM